MARNIRCVRCNLSKPKRLFTFLPSMANAEMKACAKSNVCHDCQRGTQQAQPMAAYAVRDAVLRSMGFRTYADYLASPLWARIRQRVLQLRGYRCETCRGRATLVHHNLYGRRELSGQSLRGMKAMCGACHRQVEFADGRKVGLREASHRFYQAEA